MTKNELTAKNKKDERKKRERKMLKSNTTAVGGYLIQTLSDYISLIGPRRFIIEVLSF